MRKIVSADDISIKEIAEIEKENFSEPMSEICIKKSLSSPFFGLYVNEKNGKIASYTATAEIFPEMQINSVASSEKRKGYAKELLSELIKNKREAGFKTVTLEVRVSNTPAIKLYESFGFITAGTRKKLYAKPTEDGYTMILEL